MRTVEYDSDRDGTVTIRQVLALLSRSRIVCVACGEGRMLLSRQGKDLWGVKHGLPNGGYASPIARDSLAVANVISGMAREYERGVCDKVLASYAA